MPDYHSVNLYQLRVDAAAFDICMRKFARPLQRHMSLVSRRADGYFTQFLHVGRADAIDLYDSMVSYCIYNGLAVEDCVESLGHVSS